MRICLKCGSVDRYANGRCKPCKREHNAKWVAANPDKMRAYGSKWAAANREKVRAVTDAWHAANPERRRANNARWLAENPEKNRIYVQNRRSRKREAGGNLSLGLPEKLLKLQRGKCACGCKQPLGNDYHMDHIMPLKLGGTNGDDNIQLLRANCNLQKSKKHPVDYMQSKGFLL